MTDRVFNKEVGQRIKQVRKALKLTQSAFSEPLGVKQGHISSIEKAEKDPSSTLLILIAKQYNINEEWLYTGSGVHFINKEGEGGDTIIYKESSAIGVIQIDTDLLTDVIEVVDKVLEREGIILEPAKKARFLALEYELALETGKGTDQVGVTRHLKLVA